MTASASLRRIEGKPVERFVRLMVGIMNVDADRICMGNLTGAPTTRSKGHATESPQDSTAPKERARLPTALRVLLNGQPKSRDEVATAAWCWHDIPSLLLLSE